MKFPSFIKTSRYSRFHIEPRYYDPIKEEIQGKLKAARERQNRGENEEDSAFYQSSISAAFRNRERKTNQTSVLQLAIAVGLFAMLVGWWYLGNDVFYVFLLLSPLYIYFRLRKRKLPRN